MKLDEIKELMRLFGKSKIDRMQIKQKDFEIEMEKGSGTTVVESAPQTSTAIPAATTVSTTVEKPVPSAEKKAISGETITSPMVGTFYASPSPDSPHFVQVGDKVKKGDVLCILEAMKIMNELEAEYDCKILDILVNDGDPVEYDKPLFIVEKV